MTLLAELAADPNYWGTCPSCGADVQLIEAQLFSIADELPEFALAQISRVKANLKERRNELAKAKEMMTFRAAITAESVNVGKICEKIAPSLPSFPFGARDCRCLWEPIDYLVFSGLGVSRRVDSITFLEVKTGRARLTSDQHAISTAVGAGKVEVQQIQFGDNASGQ